MRWLMWASAITVFGSARVKPGEEQYETAVHVSKLLGQTGFNIITGGGPGIMEAANKGAREAGRTIHWPQHRASLRATPQPLRSTLSIDFHYFFVRKNHARQIRQRLRHLPWRLWHNG